MKITRSLYDELLLNTPPAPPESGGILGGKDGVAVFYFPDTAEGEYDSYSPDTEKLNEIIAIWEESGIDFIGIYHSHFPGGRELSSGDKKYIKKIMSVMPESCILYFPVMLPDEMAVYRAVKTENEVLILHDDIKIIH